MQEVKWHSRYPGMIVVHVVQGMLQAQVIKTKLETAHIPVLLDYESVGQVIGITVDGLGEVRVLVPAGYVDEARTLIEEPLRFPLHEEEEEGEEQQE